MSAMLKPLASSGAAREIAAAARPSADAWDLTKPLASRSDQNRLAAPQAVIALQ
jgi:hypothetical protein